MAPDSFFYTKINSEEELLDKGRGEGERTLLRM